MHLVILVQLMLIRWKLEVFHLCVNCHPWPRLDINYTRVRGKPIRIMALPPTNQNLLMHILQAIML